MAADDFVDLRSGQRIPGEIIGSATCPQRGSIIRVRIYDGEHPVGVLRVSLSDLRFTPPLKAALMGTDENGRGAGWVTKKTLARLQVLGLGEAIGLGWRLTEAGRNAATLLREGAEHRTRTHQRGEKFFNPRRANGSGRFVRDQFATWACSCGASGGGETREKARELARSHRIEAAAAWTDLKEKQ